MSSMWIVNLDEFHPTPIWMSAMHKIEIWTLSSMRMSLVQTFSQTLTRWTCKWKFSNTLLVLELHFSPFFLSLYFDNHNIPKIHLVLSAICFFISCWSLVSCIFRAIALSFFNFMIFHWIIYHRFKVHIQFSSTDQGVSKCRIGLCKRCIWGWSPC